MYNYKKKKITKEHVSEWRCREKGQYIKSCKLTMCMTKGFVYLQHTQNTLYSLHSILPFKTPSSNLKCESKEENSVFPCMEIQNKHLEIPWASCFVQRRLSDSSKVLCKSNLPQSVTVTMWTDLVGAEMKFSLYPACLMFRGRLRKNFLAPARTAGDVGHPRTEQETLHCRRPKKLERVC